MTQASPSIEDLARRVVALEAERAGPSDPRVYPAVRACDRLRATLACLMGDVGVASLVSRALALSSTNRS